jgi:hypothetical protein
MCNGILRLSVRQGLRQLTGAYTLPSRYLFLLPA